MKRRVFKIDHVTWIKPGNEAISVLPALFIEEAAWTMKPTHGTNRISIRSSHFHILRRLSRLLFLHNTLYHASGTRSRSCSLMSEDQCVLTFSCIVYAEVFFCEVLPALLNIEELEFEDSI